jgi:hypothetical protein
MNIFSRVVIFLRDMFSFILAGVLAVLSLITTVVFIYIGIVWVLGFLVTLFLVVMSVLFFSCLACLAYILMPQKITKQESK